LSLLVVGVAVSGLSLLKADEGGSKITITGDGICAKCGLKEADAKKCQNVVIVTKDGEETKYYLADNEFSKKAHQALGICTAQKDSMPKVKVTGTCEKKDGKLVLTPTEEIKKAG
jgi:hypothetical protein